MDAQTWATIGAFLFLTFADQGMTALWAWRLGPNRARMLIMSDPLFKKLDQTLSANVEQLQSAKTDLLAMRHDLTAMSERFGGQISSLEKDLIKAVGDIKIPVLPDVGSQISTLERNVVTAMNGLELDPTVNLTIPETMIGPLTSSLRSSLKAELNRLMTEDLTDILAAAMKKAIEKGGPALNDDQANVAAEAAEIHDYLTQLAEAYKLPPFVVNIAENMGERGIRWLNERYALGLTEADLLVTR